MENINISSLSRTDLETEVAKLIYKDNINSCTVSFNYEPENHGIGLYVITHNPVHNTSFLFGKSWGLTEEGALENLLKSKIQNEKFVEHNYTIVWSSKTGVREENISYFRDKDLYNVLDKFYHGKDKKNYIIWSIKLSADA